MIWRSSSHASIFAGVTRMRMLYQRPYSNSMDCEVSFSEASLPLMLDSPTTEPPQPPRISEQNESATGNVTPAKKSRPFDAHRLQRDLVVVVGSSRTGPRDAGHGCVPASRMICPSLDLDGAFAAELGRLPVGQSLPVEKGLPSLVAAFVRLGQVGRAADQLSSDEPGTGDGGRCPPPNAATRRSDSGSIAI